MLAARLLAAAGMWFLAPASANAQPPCSPPFARNHIHAIYWRIDFDIVDFPNNAVDQLAYSTYATPDPSFPNCANFPGLCGTNTETQFLTESGDTWLSGSPFLSWRIYNRGVTNAFGRTVGYEVVPGSSWAYYGELANQMETWAQEDAWVTIFDPCELFATDNRAPFLPPECSSATPPTDVNAMAARATDISNGADLVFWTRKAFQHKTREEDQLNMPIEWQSITVQPRSWRHHSTLEP